MVEEVTAEFEAEEDLSQVPMPGQLIRSARLQRQLTPDALADKTRLNPLLIQHIEVDDYAALGQPVYARGYYRKCAEVLGLNGEALVDAYEKRSGTASPIPEINQRPSIRYREGPGWLKMTFSVLVLAALFSVAGWWLLEQQPSWLQALVSGQQVSAQPDDQQPSPTPRMPAPAQGAAPVASAALASSPAISTPQPSPQVQQAEAPAQAVATPTPVKPTPRPAAKLRIALLAGASWTEITDSKGEKLVYKLLQAGDQREVSGAPPYEIVLGRADQVRIWLDGQPVNLRPYIEDDLRARIQVSRDGQVSEG